MGSKSQRPQCGTEAWNRDAALKNIDKHIQNPTIKDGKITKAVTANPRNSLGHNIHTLSTSDHERADLHNTYLDYDHSKRLPSQLPNRAYHTSSSTGNYGGRKTYDAPTVLQQGNSYAKRAAGSSAQNERSRTKAPEYRGTPLTPFQALAQGVKDSSSQLPHLRAPLRTSIPKVESKTLSSTSSLSKHAPSSAALTKVSKTYLTTPESSLGNSSIASKQLARSINEDLVLSKDDAATTLPEKQVPFSKGASHSNTPMNAGLKDEPAANDSAFPCSYSDCTMGFSRAKDLKRHKTAEHDWCSLCNIDCEDDVALIEHRIASTLAEEGKHMACLKCGDDFHCEAGRNRHTQMVHREAQEIKCPGCGEIFERAAALLAHVSRNKCKDRSGLVSKTTLAKGRVNAALEMERLADLNGTAQPAAENESLDESTINGRNTHTATQSLLDMDNESIEQRPYSSNKTEHDDGISVGESANIASDAESGDTDSESQPNIDRLSIVESRKTATTQGWTKALFQDAQPTPVQGGWTQPKAQARVVRGGRGASTDVGSPSIIDGKIKYTDWDYFVFERDPTGRLTCPFQRCDLTFINEAAVKTHLISGFHQGTAHQCVKCLKRFKNSVALLAHMESPSTKCNVRDTQQYGHILHMVSGGFIDVNNDERGTRLADGQLRMRARTKAELAEEQLEREEKQRQRELQLAAQW